MAIARSSSGGAIPTTITSDITSSALVINVVALTGTWPNTALGDFAVTLNLGEADEERILVASYTSTQLTVPAGGRGYDSTPAQSHDTGCTVTVTNDAASAQDAQQHIVDVTRDDHTQYVKKVLYSTTGDILIATGANTPARLAVGSTGHVLTVASGVPAWSTVALANDSGWTNLTLQSGWSVSNGYTPQWRLIGNRVELRGQLATTSGFNNTEAFAGFGHAPTVFTAGWGVNLRSGSNNPGLLFSSDGVNWYISFLGDTSLVFNLDNVSFLID